MDVSKTISQSVILGLLAQVTNSTPFSFYYFFYLIFIFIFISFFIFNSNFIYLISYENLSVLFHFCLIIYNFFHLVNIFFFFFFFLKKKGKSWKEFEMEKILGLKGLEV